jgi:predicted nucleic acid-binding protein
MRLYLDANSIIYSIEGLPEFREAALAWIGRAESGGAVLTSRLSRLECRVKPLRDADMDLLQRYDGFFSRSALQWVEITADVVERATELRAQHGFRTPDAIHLASALAVPADVFLTGDRGLIRCPGLDVQILTSATSP